MSNINYTGNADTELKKYDSAIKNINLAIDKIEDSIEELKSIVGFESAEELKKNLRDKISYLREKITEIKNEKTHIYDRSRYLQKEQTKQNELKEKNNIKD